MRVRILPAVLLVSLAGCATHPRPIAALAPAPEPAEQRAVLVRPAGASESLQLPPRLADGSFATPNRNLAPAAAIWHLRTGLNVAALSCRGPSEAQLLDGYHHFLAAYRPQLASAQRAVAVSHGTVGAFDAAMTRLYNYWALPPAQAGFCVAAAQVMADAAHVDAAALPGFAVQAVATLDRPFNEFFSAYAAWRDARAAGATFAATAPVAVAPERVALAYDAAVFRMP